MKRVGRNTYPFNIILRFILEYPHISSLLELKTNPWKKTFRISTQGLLELKASPW
jgi:hypothetical protein